MYMCDLFQLQGVQLPLYINQKESWLNRVFTVLVCGSTCIYYLNTLAWVWFAHYLTICPLIFT